MRLDRSPIVASPRLVRSLRSKHPQRFLCALDHSFEAARQKVDRLPLDALDEIGVILASALKVYLGAYSPQKEVLPTSLKELWLRARDLTVFKPDEYLSPYLNPVMQGAQCLSTSIDGIVEIADHWHNRTSGHYPVSSTQVYLMSHVAHAFILYLSEMLEGWTVPF